MIIAIPRETVSGETRVAIVPSAIPPLTKLNLQVVVESGAGVAAGIEDAAYAAKGAKVATRAEVLSTADVLLQVRCFSQRGGDLDAVKPGCLVIGFCDPLGAPGGVVPYLERRLALISMELVPRVTRAQAMDALSSQANIAGYKAVIMAADTLPRIFPMLMTAAGTLQAARVFVIGAGVAGLQAIATARRLGAVVSAFDVRAAVKDQVQSVGAKFVELTMESGDAQDKGGYAKAQSAEQQVKQAALMAKVVAESDVVITTAAIPGKPAPKLIPADVVAKMQRGSVIVDLAAERGGNCELTEPGMTVVKHGVTLIGHTNIPATVPLHSSTMYANNLVKLLALLVDKQGALKINTADEVIAGCLVAQDGQVVHAAVRSAMGVTQGSAEASARVPMGSVGPSVPNNLTSMVKSDKNQSLAVGGAR